MIDICIVLDQSVSPHTGVRAYSKYRGFLAGGISDASSPLLFFGSRLRRQNFNHTIPPAAQAILLALLML